MGEDRREITLNVITPLTAHIRPQQQIVDAGTPAMFNCSVQGGSGSMHISWLKDARPLLDSTHVSIVQQGQVLFLRNVHKSDRGMYQCVARSNDESAQGSAELTLGGELHPQYFTFWKINFPFHSLVWSHLTLNELCSLFAAEHCILINLQNYSTALVICNYKDIKNQINN
jgi:hypothetical protein